MRRFDSDGPMAGAGSAWLIGGLFLALLALPSAALAQETQSVAPAAATAQQPVVTAPAPAPTQVPTQAASDPGAAASTAISGATDPAVIDPTAPAEPVVLGPDGQPIAAEAPAILPHDLSPWGMFMQADWVVKTVMIGLAIASVITWTVWLVTSLELMGAKREARRVRALLAAAPSLHEALASTPQKEGAVRDLIAAAAHEVDLSNGLPADGIKERVGSRLERIEAAAARYATRGTGILATIGSTAPFVGLFGTVWGIMNAFIGISKTQTTNLAVVAPGIAEALLATAIGLVAAIPAVVIYNKFARGISGYKALLADISAELMRLISRDLDRRNRSGVYRDAAE